MLVKNSYKIVKILKKTKAKGFEDLQEGDVLKFVIEFKKRGVDNNFNWQRPLVKIKNLRTLNVVYKEFSFITKLLNNFETMEVV